MKSKNRFLFLFLNSSYFVLMAYLLYGVWTHKIPVYWMLLFLVLLLRLPGIVKAGRLYFSKDRAYTINLGSPSGLPDRVTPDFIRDVLYRESVIQMVKNDLSRTTKIGYQEMWRLGLITPDQDVFDPRPDSGSRLERLNRGFTDRTVRYQALEQIPLKRSAALHSTSYFNTHFNNVLITNGLCQQGASPGWKNYPLYTRLNPDEYIRLRDLQINTDRLVTKNRSPGLAQFLREDGFPLKANYPDGDPLTTERGGVIAMTKDGLFVTYPQYLTQRRLIDDEGNLIDLGIDEGFSLGGVVEVKMRPAVLDSLIRHAASQGYTPVLRYHSTPYAANMRVPILDTPVSASGWADLFIDPCGRGILFIAKEKTLTEWYEMMAKLRQLFYDELAGKGYHLLGLTKDAPHLNSYLSKKLDVLSEYYQIQDWCLA